MKIGPVKHNGFSCETKPSASLKSHNFTVELFGSLLLIALLRHLVKRSVTPAAFICYQHHWTIKICWQNIAACVCVCVFQYQSVSRLYRVCVCVWEPVDQWLCPSDTAAQPCFDVATAEGPSQQEATGVTRPSGGPRLAGQCPSGLTENTDTTRSEQRSSALSFQVRSGWKITF